MKHINRDLIETIISKIFVNQVVGVNESIIPALNQHLDNSFGRSFLGFLLYCNGHNEQAKSTHYPRGLFYNDGKVIFGIGVFRREEDGLPSIHIISPHGENWPEVVTEFTKKIQQIIPELHVYIRHLTAQQKSKLHGHGWNDIETVPWHPDAWQEDEDLNDRIIVGNRFLSGGFSTTNDTERREFRKNLKKSRDAAHRFENFLKREGFSYELRECREDDQSDAEKIISRHFDFLEKEGNRVCSTASDYTEILNTVKMLPEVKKAAGIIEFIGYLVKGDIRIPVTFYAFERINAKREITEHAKQRRKVNAPFYGGYATITLRDESIIAGLVDATKTADGRSGYTGFGGLSNYAERGILHEIFALDWRAVVDLGGSELKSLNDSKIHLGAQPRETGWVVRASLKPSTSHRSRE